LFVVLVVAIVVVYLFIQGHQINNKAEMNDKKANDSSFDIEIFRLILSICLRNNIKIKTIFLIYSTSFS
jgi:hypothetical protein